MIRVGTGRATLSFPDGLGLFGFGPSGGQGLNSPVGSDEADSLEARALYLESGAHKLLVVSYDLPSGSRIVHCALLEALARDGISLLPGQLWVAGTHSHSAPGHYIGNFYDLLGQGPPFYRAAVAEEIVRKGLAAARDALRAPEQCRVGTSQQVLWGAGRNRSLRAFLGNFGGDPTVWPTELGLAPPAGLTPEQVAVDPRLNVVAFVAMDDRPLATWATWCCHAATFPRAPLRPYHRDWPGVAVDAMETAVPFAMIHQGANGDVTALPSGQVRVDQPLARVQALGAAVGAMWATGFAAALANASATAPVEVGYRTFVPRAESLPQFEVGASVLAGSEEFDPGFLTKALGEARTFPRREVRQRPKLPALGPLQWLLRLHPALKPSPEHPMGLLRLGSHLFFVSPFEQTSYAARLSEIAICKRWLARRGESVTASPMGLVGDYAGYVTSPSEFDAQHYEGGHTIYGRDQRAALERLWERMVTSSQLDATAPAYKQSEPTFHARVDAVLAKL